MHQNQKVVMNLTTKDIYKLNATDPLKYKWSLLSSWDYSSPATPKKTYSGDSGTFSNSF